MPEDIRTFTSIYTLVDNFSRNFEPIRKMLAEIKSNSYEIDISVNTTTVDALGKKLQESYGGISKTVEETTRKTRDHAKSLNETSNITDRVGSKLKDIWKGATEEIEKFHSSLTRMTESLAGMVIGGGIVGFSWIGAEKANLYEEQIAKAIGANKKLKLSQIELNDFLDRYSGSEWTTKSKMTETIQAASLYGPKYGFRGKKLEDLAESAEKIAYAKQESLGGMSGSDLVLMSSVYSGKLRASVEAQFRTATADIAGTAGYENLIKTAKGRLKLLQREAEKGGEGGTALNMQVELDKRPWAAAMNNISELKRSVGESIAGPLRTLTGLFSSLVKTIKSIPGGSALIGWVAITIAVAGALSLLASVITPVISLYGILKTAMLGQAAASQMMAMSNAAMIASYGGVVIAEEAVAVANTGVMASAYAMAGGLWAALAPVLLIAMPLLALGGILYWVEQKTHIFSKAFKELGRTQMAKDLLNWFNDVGYWIREAIKWIDSLYKMLKNSGISKIAASIAGGAAFGAVGLAIGAASAITGKSPQELLGIISDHLQNLLRWGSSIITPIIAKINEWLKKIGNIMDGVYDIVQGILKPLTTLASDIVDKIRMILPNFLGGYTDEEKAARAKGIKPGGVGWPGTLTEEQKAESLKKWKTMTPEQQKAAAERNPSGFVQWLNNVTGGLFGGGIPESEGGIAGAGQGASAPNETRWLGKAKEDAVRELGYEPYGIYTNQYGDTRFGYEVAGYPSEDQTKWHKKEAEGVANTSTTATSTSKPKVWWDSEGNGLTDEEYFELPTTEKLSGKWSYDSSKANTASTTSSTSPGKSGSSGSSSPDRITNPATGEGIQGSTTTLPGKSSGSGGLTTPRQFKPPEAPATPKGFASGATFSRSGLFAGQVHSPEEIIPQATAQRGPGPIARAIALLDSVSSRPGTPEQGPSIYTIHITNQNDFSGLKISGNVDAETLLRRIDRIIEAKSVEAVKRAIGQGRT